MDFQRILYFLPGIILGLTVHEYCHALCAFKLGDDTAREKGRLTLNPVRHIDPIGFLFIVFAGFGWARPVEFDPGRLRHPVRDRALIALAGPLSNLLLGILILLTMRFALHFGRPSQTALSLMFFSAYINFALFVFNMLPIPPLDGSHVVFAGIKLRPETEAIFQKIGLPILLLLIILQNFVGITVLPIGTLAMGLIGLFL
ncbi:MAG: site-2 protease family protein [Treponema sp.]|nr:site-2 protease family protein [Treponema sp.]